MSVPYWPRPPGLPNLIKQHLLVLSEFNNLSRGSLDVFNQHVLGLSSSRSHPQSAAARRLPASERSAPVSIHGWGEYIKLSIP